jgi:predicted RNA-binding Zn ribbon-like protein
MNDGSKSLLIAQGGHRHGAASDTSQVELDSYRDAGVFVAVDLVNAFVVDTSADDPVAVETLGRTLAVDPPSVAQLGRAVVAEFRALAAELAVVFAALDRGNVDEAAVSLNRLLARHPAYPHLTREDGGWRLHHHPADAVLIPMWTAICAEGLARLVGAGHADRLGTCERPGCGRVFVDVSKNGSRRFCSLACQNRVKTAAFRRRRATAKAEP